MTQLHAVSDGRVADLLGGAPLAHVVLLLRPLGPVGRGGPGDGGQTPVLFILACLDGLGALLSVAILVITNIAFQARH